MKKAYNWLKSQTKDRPFFSALIVLGLFVVPGFFRLENAVDTANDAAASAQAAAESASDTANQLAQVIESEAERNQAIQLANCQTRNNAQKISRDRFEAFFTVMETLLLNVPGRTEEQLRQTQEFINSLRAGTSSDPALEDVDCNQDGQLTEADYG